MATPQTYFGNLGEGPSWGLRAPGQAEVWGLHLLAASSVTAFPYLWPAGMASIHQPANQVISKAPPFGEMVTRPLGTRADVAAGRC